MTSHAPPCWLKLLPRLVERTGYAWAGLIAESSWATRLAVPSLRQVDFGEMVEEISPHFSRRSATQKE